MNHAPRQDLLARQRRLATESFLDRATAARQRLEESAVFQRLRVAMTLLVTLIIVGGLLQLALDERVVEVALPEPVKQQSSQRDATDDVPVDLATAMAAVMKR